MTKGQQIAEAWHREPEGNPGTLAARIDAALNEIATSRIVNVEQMVATRLRAALANTKAAAEAHDTAVAQRAREPVAVLEAALVLVRAEYAFCVAEGGFEMDQNKAAQAELKMLLASAIRAREGEGHG